MCLAHLGKLVSPGGIVITWSGGSGGSAGEVINIINLKTNCPVREVYVAETEVDPIRPHHTHQKENCFHLLFIYFQN